MTLKTEAAKLNWFLLLTLTIKRSLSNTRMMQVMADKIHSPLNVQKNILSEENRRQSSLDSNKPE